MKHPLYVFILVFVLIQLFACSEFLSEDVSELVLVILSPADSLNTQVGEVTFWWDDAPDADLYHLQVVSPDFDQPTVLIDTLLEENQITFHYPHGAYAWRVRAENADSESIYQAQIFTVDTVIPTIPSPIFPFEGDTLVIGEDPSLLRWQSGDPAINRREGAVSDSVRLFELVGNNIPVLRANFFVSAHAIREVNITNAISAVPIGQLARYQWQVVSIDLAGNKRTGPVFSFFLK